MGCAKMAEPNKMSLDAEFSGSREHVLHVDVDAPMRGGNFGCLAH